MELLPYEPDCEVGKGFLVVVMPTAAAEILMRFENLMRFMMVQRSYATNGTIVDGPALQASEAFSVQTTLTD